MNMFRNAAVLVTAAVLASCGEQTDERQQSNGPADKASISGWVIGASLPGSFGPGYILVHEKLDRKLFEATSSDGPDSLERKPGQVGPPVPVEMVAIAADGSESRATILVQCARGVSYTLEEKGVTMERSMLKDLLITSVHAMCRGAQGEGMEREVAITKAKEALVSEDPGIAAARRFQS
tara:strand:- start:6113 stop:6652 length:540 start_codon:yes stop_codon:yes gene_type:complete